MKTRCQITLKPKEEVRIQNGHPWVYNNEIASISGPIESGSICEVYSSNQRFIGQGFLNTASKIFVRIITRQEIELTDAFFKELIVSSNQRRLDLGYIGSYRVLFGESDGFPGLIVDKYEDYLSIQVLSYGAEIRKAFIIDTLVALFHPLGIMERSDALVRKKEGLEPFSGVIYGNVPPLVAINENGLTIHVDLYQGQKTGYFLDQQANHAAIKPYVLNKTVLDCFSHTGGFGLHAALYQAKSVVCVDISQRAVDRIIDHAQINRLTQVSAVKADVFEYLRTLQNQSEKYDVIILDPPAFTKNNENVDKAYAGYKEINLQAMKCIHDNGYLITSSCSHYMTPALFLDMLMQAAIDAKKVAHMIEFKIQGKDHPTLLGNEESLYLKFVVLRISNPR